MKFQAATLRRLSLTVALVACLSVSACKTAKKADESSAIPSGATMDENALGDSDSGKAMGIETIYFPYDSFSLTGEAKSKLNAGVQIMKDKPTLKIQIEGHADQRGGIQYNIALGEKRANIVKKYMVDQGIDENRISTISYGKERPVDQGTSEEAYAKNRRANFVITSR